jgi:hypothetical protein
MRLFRPYVRHLQDLLEQMHASNAAVVDIEAALDGGAGRELRRRVDVHTLRKAGAFFTGSYLATQLADRIGLTLTRRSVVVDPACGAGDLLLAVGRLLPVRRTVSSTLREWSGQLIGRDLHEPFVGAAKLRVALLAAHRGATVDVNAEMAASLLPEISHGSGLSRNAPLERATHVILNPPFSLVSAPQDCEWGQGSVNAAAVFLEECVRRANAGTRVVAILPDVLRSGSRYLRWRTLIGARTEELNVQLHGQFNAATDVHTFLLDCLVRNEPPKTSSRRLAPTERRQRVLDDIAHVHTGPVVEYREPNRGAWHPFIVARALPKWRSIVPLKSRRFRGRVFKPPFVVVRRTSRPEDSHRAIATLVLGNRPIAIENHLLVVVPRHQSRSACVAIMTLLRDPRTTTWLNARIRCRHLTVSALCQLPIWGSAT